MICDGLVFLSFFVPFFPPPSTETSEEPLVDLSDVLNTDADILGMLGKPSSDSGASYKSHRQSQWQEFINSHLAVGFIKSFAPGSEISSDSEFILISPLNDFFFFKCHIL